MTSTLVSPALSIAELVLRDLDLPEHERRDYNLKTALLTHETQNTLQYHFTIVRDFALADESVGKFVHESVTAAFAEDAHGLELVTRVKLDEADRPFYECSVPSDRASVAMRRHLRKLADAEPR